MRTTHSAARMVLGSADLAALALLRPHPATLIADLAAPHAWIERVGVDAALATLAGAALWVAALWLAVGLAAALAARLPGVAGQCSARMCEALLPRALRGVVAGSAGLGILLTPAAALAAHGPAGRAVAADTVPAPAWPVDLGATPTAPATTPPSPARTESSATGSVTVRPGDSLWLIAARSLGPRPTDEQVAAAWPRWFAANRSVIGPDPGLIRPGQTLRPPTPTDAAPTTLEGCPSVTALLAPAPIPTRIVIRPAPRREPPFDDELAPGHARPGPLDQRLPFDLPPAPPIVWRAGPARRRGLSDPSAWGRRLLIGLIETAGGRRPLHQLSTMLSPSVARGLGTDFERAARVGAPHWLHRAAVRTVRVCEPAEAVAEICATVETGRRVRALALRLEEHHGRWRCTRLQLG